jgi:predicted nucleic acid-binding protein
MRLPRRFFVETSFIYAGFDPTDSNHSTAEELTKAAAAERCILHCTWDVVSEAVTLLRYRLGFPAALRFLDQVRPGLKRVPFGDRIRSEAEKAFRKYGPDHRLSFGDAISFVGITTMLRRMPCATFDDDFRSFGLPVIL